MALIALVPAAPAKASRSPLRFEPYATLFAGEGSGVAIADVTGDGRKDVVYTGGNTRSPFGLFVLAQQANGSLASPRGYLNDGGALAVGDLNGDRRTDIATTGVRGINVFLQRSGGLASPTIIPNTKDALLLEVADMDRDGRKDLVYSVNGGWIRLARNTRRGFAVSTISARHHLPLDIEVGDVTGDGRKDIVAVWDPTFSVFRQRRNGSFAPPVVYSAFYDLEAVEIADVTGDGLNDVSLSVGNNYPNAAVAVFAQNAIGGLERPVAYDSFDIPDALEAADMDGDGGLDLVTIHSGWVTLGIYLQSYDRKLEEEDLYPAPYSGSNPKNIAIGDVSGDGRLDIVAAISPYDGLIIFRQLPRRPPPSVRYTQQTTTGQAIVPGAQDIGLHCNDCVQSIAFPFPVSFYGQRYTSAWVSSNGPLMFDSPDPTWANQCVPTLDFERALIPYWDDLSTEPAGMGVFTRTIGSPPARTFVVEWRTEYIGQYLVNFEALFQEGSGVVSVIIGPTGFWGGSSATSGIQYDQGNFTKFSCWQPDVLVEGVRVDYVPTPNPPPPQRASCVVPRVIGLRLASARRRIRTAHCSLGRVKPRRSTHGGRVLAQSPRPGATRRAGAPINLVVGRRR